MKRIILSSLLITAFCLAASASEVVAKGKTNSPFGDYKIEVSENPVTINGKQLDAFIVSYNNTNLKVIIAIEKNRKCKKYYVLSDALSVQYVCNKDFFGVEKLGKDLEKEGYKTSEASLNREEYFHQKVLTRGNNYDLDNTRLIASYFPRLLIIRES
jgi:hypothetical protein